MYMTKTEIKVELMIESIILAIVNNKALTTKAFKAYLKEESLDEDSETFWDYIENQYYNDINDVILENNEIGQPRQYFGFSGVLKSFAEALSLVDKEEQANIYDIIAKCKDETKDKIKKETLDYFLEYMNVEAIEK